MDRHRRTHYLAGAVHDRRHPTDAVHAAKALDWQAQSDRGVRTETPVSTISRTNTSLN